MDGFTEETKPRENGKTSIQAQPVALIANEQTIIYTHVTGHDQAGIITMELLCKDFQLLSFVRNIRAQVKKFVNIK